MHFQSSKYSDLSLEITFREYGPCLSPQYRVHSTTSIQGIYHLLQQAIFDSLAESPRFLALLEPGSENSWVDQALEKHVGVALLFSIFRARMLCHTTHLLEAEVRSIEPQVDHVDVFRTWHLAETALRLLYLSKFIENSQHVAHFLPLHVVFNLDKMFDEFNIAFMEESKKFGLQVSHVELSYINSTFTSHLLF